MAKKFCTILLLNACLIPPREAIADLTQQCLLHSDYRRTCFYLELADEPNERNVGLMRRESLPPRHGMLFDFGEVQTVGMWMKNTYIPLDMVFLNAQGRVVFIHRRAQAHSLEIISPPMPVRYTLELNAGAVDAYEIALGDRLLRALVSR